MSASACACAVCSSASARRSWATRSAFTFQQVQKYEKGSNRISASRLQGIARLLDVPVAYFFEDAPVGVPIATETVVRLAPDGAGLLESSEGVQLANAFVAIDDAQIRRRLVDLAEALAKRGG